MTKIYSIYLIHNTINQKKYVGQTNDVCARWKAHKKIKGDCKIHRAFRKYGIDNFIFEVIYQSYDRTHVLEMEKFFIIQHNSYNKGYNETLGGEGSIGYKHSDKTKKKISENTKKNKNIHLPKSDKHKEKISKSLKDYKRTKEHQDNSNNANRKWWFIITKDTGETIKTWNLQKFEKENNYCKLRRMVDNPNITIRDILSIKVGGDISAYVERKSFLESVNQKKKYEIEFNDGNTTIANSLTKFGDEYNYDGASLYRVLSGKQKRTGNIISIRILENLE